MAATSSAPPPSAVTSLLASELETPSSTSAVALEILHNLQHQHLWTSLQVHEPQTPTPQSTPLVSGIPPQPIYTHPDEQAYMLEHGIRPDETPAEREWIVPTSQGEKLTLRRLASVFDGLPGRNEDLQLQLLDHEKSNKTIEEYINLKKKGEWGTKRVLLAMVNRGMGGDGTVVYYMTLEGSVKPRQN